MANNIYEAPTSSLEIERVEKSQAEFYVVSKTKFSVLFIATMGLYSAYWFYKNWNLYRHSSGENLWPVPRGIFSVFFVHSLFRKIDAKNKENQNHFSWDPESQATIIVVLMIVLKVLDRASQKNLWSPFSDILSIALLLPLNLYLLNAQAAINLVCADPKGDSNKNFSVANYIWISLGIVLWAALIYAIRSGE